MSFLNPSFKSFVKEIYLEQRVEFLALIYRAAQKDLARKIQDIDITDFNKTRSEILLTQINQEIVRLDLAARKWTKETIPLAYSHGLDLSQERLRSLGVSKYVNMNATVHKSAISVLVDSITLDFLVANQTIKKNVNQLIRATQQQVIEDVQISKMISQGLVEGETRKQISDRLQAEFEKQLKEEKFITINGRNYEPQAYSRLVSRSRVMESSNQANINASLQYGVDLVQVDIHSGSCEICDPYQGKIYSISGQDKDFPPLEERPPFHPNCRHLLLPMTRESLIARGLLQGSIRLSNSTNQMVDTVSDYEEVASA
jgi:hypothetical protein